MSLREFFAALNGPGDDASDGDGMTRSELEDLKQRAADFQKTQRLKLATKNGEIV